MTMVPRFAVITTYNRPELALQCIKSLDDVDDIIVVDNGSREPMPPPDESRTLESYSIIQDDTQPVNLSALWNLGIREAKMLAHKLRVPSFDVAILNDDVIVPPEWFSRIQWNMRASGAWAGCTGPIDHVQRNAQPIPLHMRMTGWAFVLRSEPAVGVGAGFTLNANEDLKWWYGDDDLDWTARNHGGMVMVRSAQPANLYPNGLMTPERHVQAALDRATFEKKWGRTPW